MDRPDGPATSHRPRTIAAVADATSAPLREDLVRRLRDAGHLRGDRVAEAFVAVPRELFLTAHVERHGVDDVYRDDAIVTRRDAATGRPTSSSSQPAIMARMLDMLAVERGARVLEIGAGTGYNAALLAHLVGEHGAVTSVELDADVAVDARRALLAARSTARVEVGDGAAGWPAAAPVDAVMATASVDRVPRAWFDQLRPGGRLVVPLRLSPVVPWLQAVVAYRKVRSGFDPVAVTPGAFMALRRPDHGGDTGRPTRLAVGEVADGDSGRVHLELAGPALAGLDRAARQRLVLTALGFARRRQVPLGPGSAHGLLTYVALALPEQRLVEVEHSGPGLGREALGTVDAVDGSLAVLVPGPGGRVRLDAYGGPGAERGLLSAVERWALAGRPGVASARIAIRYGPVRPHGWHSARRGDQWMALDWARLTRTLPGHGSGRVPAVDGRHLRRARPGPGRSRHRRLAHRGAGRAGPGRAQGRPCRPGARGRRRARLVGVAVGPAGHRPRRGRGPLRGRVPALRRDALRLPLTPPLVACVVPHAGMTT